MDIGTAVTGAILVAVCVLPFVLLSRSGKKRQKQLLQMLSGLAQNRQGKIAQYDFWADSAIALDEAANYLYFIRKMGDQDTVSEIDLSSIQKCKAVNISRTVDKKNGNYKVIEKLALLLSPADKGAPEVELEFYDVENDVQINWDVQLLDKWAKAIEGRLKKRNVATA